MGATAGSGLWGCRAQGAVGGVGLEAECETHGRLAVPARPQLARHLLASQAAARARLLRCARPGATLIDGTRPPNPTRLTPFSHTRTHLRPRPQLGCSCATAPSLCAHSPSLCAHSSLPLCPQLPPDSSLAQPIAQPVPTRHTAPHHTPPVACPSAAASPRRATVAPDPRCARPARRGDRRAALAPAPRAGRRCGHRRGRVGTAPDATPASGARRAQRRPAAASRGRRAGP